MTITLPTQVSAAHGWTLTDYMTMQARSAPAVGGQCSVTFAQLGSAERWQIDHAVVICDSTTPTTLRLYESVATPLSLLDGSGAGAFDVADWPGGLGVQPTQALLAVWTGASDGAVGTIALQARVLRND
jgi:hypothetical protein